jgi:molybdenum cofactor cytidylyltransferase
MRENQIGIIVLAAGASVRMGTPKQLLKIAGVSLIRRAAQNAIDSKCRPVVIVLGANADLIRDELEGLEIQIAVNHDWEIGMSTSIRCGVKTLLTIAPETDGAILMLGDQPNVTGAALEKLTGIFAQNNSAIIAARYLNQLGTPVLFPRAYFGELLKLNGKGGAKNLLKKYGERALAIDLPEAALDLDTPEDLCCFSFKQATASQLSQRHPSNDSRGLQNGR